MDIYMLNLAISQIAAEVLYREFVSVGLIAIVSLLLTGLALKIVLKYYCN